MRRINEIIPVMIKIEKFVKKKIEVMNTNPPIIIPKHSKIYTICTDLFLIFINLQFN